MYDFLMILIISTRQVAHHRPDSGRILLPVYIHKVPACVGRHQKQFLNIFALYSITLHFRLYFFT